MNRYARQEILPWIGSKGQRCLESSTVGIAGLGALGTTCAALLARAGVGGLILVDRDVVEESNLSRQTLYTEADVSGRLPKAEAAARHLLEISSGLRLEPWIADIKSEEATELFLKCDLVLDGSDNFETRFLLNDAAVKARKPWIYAGAIGEHGALMTVLPGEGPCLRCVFPNMPPMGSVPTCETAGVFGPAPCAVASFQASEALKLLIGRREKLARGFVRVNLDGPSISVTKFPRNSECPCCAMRRFDFLEERGTSTTHHLCGQDGVMVLAPKGTRLDLRSLEARLRPLCDAYRNPYLIQAELEGHKVTIYEDGRAMIQGTNDAARARALYARYLGM